jgi:2-dehydropantoate 2-reductase
MAGLCVTQLAPGVVAQTMGNTISLGNYPLGCDKVGAEVAEHLARAGFEVTTHESIMAVKWSKLILNLNNAIYAIIDQHLQLGLVTPEISDFMADVEEEGLHVLNVAGISLADPGNPIDFEQRLRDLRSVKAAPEKLREAASIPVELRTYPSTWTDLRERRGETEAGYFNGEIMLLGEKHDVPTPYNSTLLNVVETMALEGQSPGRYDLEELVNLVEQRRLMIYHDD